MKIAIIGGGAAGYFAAANLVNSSASHDIRLFEQAGNTLQKVKISGGGRCNVTHACWTPQELVRNYPRGEKELLGPFTRFCCGDTMEWFESRGVALKIEEDGRVFPVSDQSQSVIDCLQREVKKNGVAIKLRYKWSGIDRSEEGDGYKLTFKNGETYTADKVIITTGAGPFVWNLLKGMNLDIRPPVPSLFTFNIPDRRLHRLAGISVPHAEVSVEGVGAESGPVLITHWGLSGPAILKMSAFGARELAGKEYSFTVKIRWLELEELREWMDSMRSNFGKKSVSNAVPAALPNRLWNYLLIKSGIDPGQKVGQLTKENWRDLYSHITTDRFKVKGKSTFKEEFVTAGGVNLKEMNFRNFELKRFPGIHLAGEVLDIDAVTGGFNFQNAWTGGWVIADYLNRNYLNIKG